MDNIAMYNHHNNRQDVYTISNPMTYSYATGMGNNPTKLHMQPGEISHDTWQQQMNLNESSVSITDRNNVYIPGGFHDKEVTENRKPCKSSKFKVALNGIICVLAAAVILGVELGFVPHKKQSFICKDPSLSYHYTGDTIRPSVLAVSCVFLPLGIFVSVEVLRNGKKWRIVTSLVWRWCKNMIIGNIIITLFVSEVLKSIFGELRPHFFDTCSPDSAMTCTAGEVIENYRCTNTQYNSVLINDSSRSFPSAHAGIAVFTSLYCAAYIYYRLRATSLELGSLCKPFIIAVVSLLGPACGLTRITDHRHHWWDVLAGSIIGGTSALFTIYGLVKRFQWDEDQPRVSSSSTKLWNERNNHDNASV